MSVSLKPALPPAESHHVLSLGIAFALASALATNVALLMKHRGAVAAATVRMRHPLASAAALFRSRWWALGFGVAAIAWALHIVALGLAPLSVVETVISGGLVVLAYAAQAWFGISVGRRELAGLGLAAAGLALIGATSAGAHASDAYSGDAMAAFEAGAVGFGAVLLLSGAVGGARAVRGPLLAAAAGLLLGVANVSIKALATTVPADPASLAAPWTAVALAAGLASFFALARAMQTGEAVPVIGVTTIAANCASVSGGILVFGDSVGADPAAIVARSVAFAAVLLSVALMPAQTGARAHAPARA